MIIFFMFWVIVMDRIILVTVLIGSHGNWINNESEKRFGSQTDHCYDKNIWYTHYDGSFVLP